MWTSYLDSKWIDISVFEAKWNEKLHCVKIEIQMNEHIFDCGKKMQAKQMHVHGSMSRNHQVT